MEFRVAKKLKDLEKMADEAIRQTEDRQYASELMDDGYETVGKYRIAFCGKDCMVKFRQ